MWFCQADSFTPFTPSTLNKGVLYGLSFRSRPRLAAQAQAKLEISLLNPTSGEEAYSPEEETAIREFFNSAETRKDEASGAVAYYWPRTKWYSDYPEVRFIESFLIPSDEMEYYFLRLGEYEDDTEVSGGFWENPLKMALNRSIAFA